ncbi:carbohydrate ABC transporter permease [Paenibacillus thalictri]|uniref:Sugar ABC transporter permease n=1 Tax=Paenibacillus thalictri TaxID=2527873 RepID=A0A4Q9DK00_9BACL|nr:sugar ABC transporter permease [Paenibacillus thalictri]TBL73888.1 sugar ABC transporter permease [Paenibacillus thalictri]
MEARTKEIAGRERKSIAFSARKLAVMRDGYLFIMPSMIIIALFTVYPTIRLFWLSLNRYRMVEGNQQATFIGLENYVSAVDDSLFWKTLWTSFYFPLVITPIQTALALLVAILLTGKIRFPAFFRTVYFIPVVMSFVIVGMFWKEMLNTNSGLINGILALVHVPQISFLTDPSLAKLSIAMVSIWKSWGWYLVIFIAALIQIPKELFESADIDGTTPWQRFLYITLPMIRRTMLFVIIVSTMNCIKLFTPILVMTGGGPSNSTRTIVHHIWMTAFRTTNNFGFAGAMAIMLFFIVVTISFIQYMLMKNED